MALANDIRALRDRVLADLHAAHDYYSDTIMRGIRCVESLPPDTRSPFRT
jgi:hypothetical protein